MKKAKVKGKTGSSQRWLQRQMKDSYAALAKKQGYRARAVYKLLELQEKDKILQKGYTVIDLGAAPGSWSQYVAQVVGHTGRVIALDCLPIDPIPGVEIIQGDFTEDSTLKDLVGILGNNRADVVISDMAPNISGIALVDQAKAIMLAEYALDFSLKYLKKDGNFLVKLFQGEGFTEYMSTLKSHFGSVVIRKPKASRSESKEVYILARELK